MFQLKSFYAAEQEIYRHRCLALINEEGKVEWSADYDVWVSLLSENNPHSLVQDIRLPASSMTRKPACTTTATVITTRGRDVIF